MRNGKRSRFGDASVRVAALLFATGVLLAGTARVQAGAALAMVTDQVGEAVIAADGKQSPSEILTELTSGAELRITAGARLTLVYFASGREYRYQGPATLRIEPGAPRLLSGREPTARDLAVVKETGLVSSPARSYGQAAIVLRGAKKHRLRLLSPRNTKILERRPMFRWVPLGASIQYRFVLLDAAGRTILETLVNGTELKLPAQVRIQADTDYSWRVEARLASGTVYASSADFTILDDGARQRVESLRPAVDAPFAERVVYAAGLERMDLRDAARREWRALAAQRPQSAGLRALAGK